MAGKNYEFRPDRTGATIIDKLYLTQKQRLSLLKWALYALVLLVLSVLQDVMLCHLDLFGATTDLVPCAIFTICVLEGAENGSLFSLAAALVFLLSGSSPGVHVVVLIPFLAVAVTVFRQSYLRKGLAATFLCAAAALMVYELVTFFVALFLAQTNLGRLMVAVITGGLSILIIPITYPILVSIGKIGGETWKE